MESPRYFFEEYWKATYHFVVELPDPPKYAFFSEKRKALGQNAPGLYE